MWNVAVTADGAADVVLAGGVQALSEALISSDADASAALADMQQGRNRRDTGGSMEPELLLAASRTLLEAAVATARNLSVDASVAFQLAAQPGILPVLLRMLQTERSVFKTVFAEVPVSIPHGVGRLASMRRDAALILWQISGDAIRGSPLLLSSGLASSLPPLLQLRTPPNDDDGNDDDNAATTRTTASVPTALALGVSDEHRAKVAFAEAYEHAVAETEENEAQQALVKLACNLACDEGGAEQLLEAALIPALTPWLLPNLAPSHSDTLIPLKCIELACACRRRLAAKAALAGAVSPCLAVLTDESTEGKRSGSQRLPLSLIPACRALWHMAHTRPGLGAIVRAPWSLATFLALQQRSIKQTMRLELLELSCAVLDSLCATKRSEGRLKKAAERQAWLSAASAARTELNAASPSTNMADVAALAIGTPMAPSSPLGQRLLGAIPARACAPDDTEPSYQQRAASAAARNGDAMPAELKVPLADRLFYGSVREVERVTAGLLSTQPANPSRQQLELPSRALRLMRIALSHLVSGELPPSTPNPWHTADDVPSALVSLLGGTRVTVYADACSCIGLLAMSGKHLSMLVRDGAVEALHACVPPLATASVISGGGSAHSPFACFGAAAEAASAAVLQAGDPKLAQIAKQQLDLVTRRSLPPWRADEASAAEKREEIRLQSLAALRQLVLRASTSNTGCPHGTSADVAARLVAIGAARTLIAQVLGGRIGLVSPIAVGEAALTLDALVELSHTCELDVFETGASASLADAVADVLRTRAGTETGDPRRDAASPWASEVAEAFQQM